MFAILAHVLALTNCECSPFRFHKLRNPNVVSRSIRTEAGGGCEPLVPIALPSSSLASPATTQFSVSALPSSLLSQSRSRPSPLACVGVAARDDGNAKTILFRHRSREQKASRCRSGSAIRWERRADGDGAERRRGCRAYRRCGWYGRAADEDALLLLDVSRTFATSSTLSTFLPLCLPAPSPSFLDSLHAPDKPQWLQQTEWSAYTHTRMTGPGRKRVSKLSVTAL